MIGIAVLKLTKLSISCSPMWLHLTSMGYVSFGTICDVAFFLAWKNRSQLVFGKPCYPHDLLLPTSRLIPDGCRNLVRVTFGACGFSSDLYDIKSACNVYRNWILRYACDVEIFTAAFSCVLVVATSAISVGIHSGSSMNYCLYACSLCTHQET